MKKRPVRTMKFIDAQDASRIAGLLFTMRANPRPDAQALDRLKPEGPFARKVARAIVGEGRSKTKRAKRPPAGGAREAAAELLPLASPPSAGNGPRQRLRIIRAS
jgi:hypothetical protein